MRPTYRGDPRRRAHTVVVVPEDPLHRLPDEVTIDLEEIRALVIGLERLESALSGAHAVAVNDLIGQVLRWLWPILDDLDDGED